MDSGIIRRPEEIVYHFERILHTRCRVSRSQLPMCQPIPHLVCNFLMRLIRPTGKGGKDGCLYILTNQSAFLRSLIFNWIVSLSRQRFKFKLATKSTKSPVSKSCQKSPQPKPIASATTLSTAFVSGSSNQSFKCCLPDPKAWHLTTLAFLIKNSGSGLPNPNGASS